MSGIGKVKVTKRLEQLAKIEKESTPTDRKPVNLLALINVRRDAVAGTWRAANGALLSPDMRNARLQIPYIPPQEYALQIVVTRTSGTAALMVGLVTAQRQFGAVIDGGGKDAGGLCLIDGKEYRKNETAFRGHFLTKGKAHKLVYVVRDSSVNVYCDGRELIAWRGDPRRLSLSGGLAVRDPRVLFLSTWASNFVIHSITLTPITGRGTVVKNGN